jgi:hypothetical protein
MLNGCTDSLLFHPPEDRLDLFNDTHTQIIRTCGDKAYFTTTSGRLGVGPSGMELEDLVIVALGVKTVFILREVPGFATCQFVVDAFVPGFMELSKMPPKITLSDVFVIE